MDEPTSYFKIIGGIDRKLKKIKNNKIILVCSHNKNLFKYFDEVIYKKFLCKHRILL